MYAKINYMDLQDVPVITIVEYPEMLTEGTVRVDLSKTHVQNLSPLARYALTPSAYILMFCWIAKVSWTLLYASETNETLSTRRP